jgi:hypothetical protein
MPELARITPERYPLTSEEDTQFSTARRDLLPENAAGLITVAPAPDTSHA